MVCRLHVTAIAASSIVRLPVAAAHKRFTVPVPPLQYHDPAVAPWAALSHVLAVSAFDAVALVQQGTLLTGRAGFERSPTCRVVRATPERSKPSNLPFDRLAMTPGALVALGEFTDDLDVGCQFSTL